MTRLSDGDRALVAAAAARAEAGTSGQVVTAVARRSDEYRDVGLHWAALAMLGVPAALAEWPGAAERIYARFDPWAPAAAPGGTMLVALALSALAFLGVRAALASMAVRLALTPGRTEARRVRRRALELFRAAAEGRTRGRTAVLLYLSLDERRAEIVADAAIHAAVPPDAWGEAMAALLPPVRAGRPGEGMAAAVERIGAVLAQHFPAGDGDVNELPDRLIEL